LNAAKKEVVIYDYVDIEVPLLVRMHGKRRAGYKAMGYKIVLPGTDNPLKMTFADF
jgi:predicted membrane-bound spermidine synthase